MTYHPPLDVMQVLLEPADFGVTVAVLVCFPASLWSNMIKHVSGDVTGGETDTVSTWYRDHGLDQVKTLDDL